MIQRTIPAHEAPCMCNLDHRPRPPYNHEHHVWPLGRGGPDTADNIVVVCPAGHDIIHAAMRSFDRAGAVVPLRINRWLYDLAARGWVALP